MKTKVYETAMALVILAALFIITSIFPKYWFVQRGQQIFYINVLHTIILLFSAVSYLAGIEGKWFRLRGSFKIIKNTKKLKIGVWE